MQIASPALRVRCTAGLLDAVAGSLQEHPPYSQGVTSHKLRRKGIPDHLRRREFAPLDREAAPGPERLQQRGFAERNTPAFGRVQKSAFGRITAPARDGWGDGMVLMVTASGWTISGCSSARASSEPY